MSLSKRSRMAKDGASSSSSDEEEELGRGNSAPTAFQTLLSSLQQEEYSESSTSSNSEEEEEEVVGEEEEELLQEEEESSDGQSEEGEEEEEYDIPTTLLGHEDESEADEEDASSDDEAAQEEDEDEDDANEVETTHPFSKPQTVVPISETFACETGDSKMDELQTYSLSGALHDAQHQNTGKGLPIKARLKQTWDAYREAKGRIQDEDEDEDGAESSLAKRLLPLMQGYSDVMFEDRTLFNAAELREMYAFHAANHLFTFRDLVIRHDAKRGSENAVVIRDQGFTRARILVILPYKSSAFRFIKLLIELFPPKTGVKNMDRFVEEFGPGEDEEEEEGEEKAKSQDDWRVFQRHCKSSESYTESDFAEGTHPCMAEARRAADWHASFEENAEEDFRIGLSMQSARSLKLYSGFYDSDVIVASPLGLRLATKQAMETQGETEDKKDEDAEDEINEDEILDKPKRSKPQRRNKAGGEEEEDVDFLSSIELLIIDEADVYHTQNWQHLEDVCKGLNRRPKALRKGMDLTRVYNHLLQNSKRRQTLVFSAYPDAQLHALVHKECADRNKSAVVIRAKSYPGTSLLCRAPGLVQRFRGVASTARLDLFANQIIPRLLNNAEGGTVLFVPDYLEYVRVRNLFREQSAQLLKAERDLPKKKKTSLFESICEYSSKSKVARARSLFFHGKTRVLIMTERLHYYFRYQIRGIAKLVFYSPPQHPAFYAELVRLTRDEVITFYTELDVLELERVLGTKKTKRALANKDKDVVVV